MQAPGSAPPPLALQQGREDIHELASWIPHCRGDACHHLVPPLPLLPDSHLNPAHRLSSFPTSPIHSFSPNKSPLTILHPFRTLHFTYTFSVRTLAYTTL